MNQAFNTLLIYKYIILFLITELLNLGPYSFTKMKNPIGFIYKITLLGFLSSIIICLSLWHNSRTFPTIPVLNFIPPIPIWLNFLLLGTLICFLAGAIFINKPKLFIPVILISTTVLILLDINRLQPEFYIFSIILLLVYLYECKKINEQTWFLLLCILVSAIYIFTGLNKLNDCFYLNVFKPFVYKLQSVLPSSLFTFLLSKSILIPLVEIAIGITIWISKLKKTSFFLTVCFHVTILVFLSPLVNNYNYAVFPWNICMIAYVFVLYKHKTGYNVLKTAKENNYVKTILFLFVFIPTTHFVNFADSFISFDVYSGKYSYTYVFITEEMYSEMPLYIKKYAVKNDSEHNDYRLYIEDWATHEIKVPIYYDEWVLKRFQKFFSQFSYSGKRVNLVVMRNNEEKVLE